MEVFRWDRLTPARARKEGCLSKWAWRWRALHQLTELLFHPAPTACEGSPGGLGLPYHFLQVPRAPTAHQSALLPLQPQPPGLSPEAASP